MSGSRGPLSKPDAIRRNLPGRKIALPMDGWQGPIPDWPLHDATRAEMERWERLWRTAQAAQWIRMHIDSVVARYVRLSLIVEAEMSNNVATAQTLNAVTALEKELGLSPAALKRLEWEIVADQADDQPVAASAKPRRRLRAVDPEAG